MNMRRATMLALTIAVIAMVTSAGNASAALSLDPGFGVHGIAKVPGAAGPEAVAPEAVTEETDGGLILAGQGTLERLDPTGSFDPSFGVTLPAPPGGAFSMAAATVDSQGRIVVVGTATPEQPDPKPLPSEFEYVNPAYESRYTDVRLLRYLPDGTLDPSFGVGGIVESDLGLPTPESKGVKLAAGPVVEATGVAIDRSGRILVTGGAGSLITGGGCFHDDYFPTLSYAGFVARFTDDGALDKGFGAGGVFGGRSKFQNPLRMEVTADPAITPGGEVIVQRGAGHCPDFAGSLGYFRLTAAGKVRSSRGVHALHGRVTDAAAAPGGATVLLVGPGKGSEARPRIVELKANGSPDESFGHHGEAVLPLPDPRWSGADGVQVLPDGEILAQATVAPPPKRGEGEARWWSRFSIAVLGLTAKGGSDSRVGPKGIVTKHIPDWWESGGFWLDGQGRPTISIEYRPKGAPVGFAAARFKAPR